VNTEHSTLFSVYIRTGGTHKRALGPWGVLLGPSPGRPKGELYKNNNLNKNKKKKKKNNNRANDFPLGWAPREYIAVYSDVFPWSPALYRTAYTGGGLPPHQWHTGPAPGPAAYATPQPAAPPKTPRQGPTERKVRCDVCREPEGGPCGAAGGPLYQTVQTRYSDSAQIESKEAIVLGWT
jgi:hypothetical protein